MERVEGIVDEPKTDLGMEPVEGHSSTVITEQRVTRTVIRRRTQAAPPPLPDEVHPEVVNEPQSPPPPVEEMVVSAEPPVEAVEAVPQVERKAPRKPGLKKASARVEPEIAPVEEEVKVAPPPPPETPKVVAPKAPEKVEPIPGSEYLGRYKRIKVVKATDSGNLVPEVRLGKAADPQQPAPPTAPAPGPGSGSGRREFVEVRNFRSPKMGKRKRLVPGKKGKKTEITTPKAIKRVVKISDGVTVSDLAKKMSVKASELMQKLVGMGTMVTINQSIDVDTASLVAAEFGYEVDNVFVAPEDLLKADEAGQVAEQPEDLMPRPPVVTVMGHVDHGKTSLLDAIRKTNVAAGEAGGITQHIGAYSVKMDGGRMITFVDTPGHEAFTAMRARGGKVSDIVILVVAGDDGVMPQTKEAVNHAKAAGVSIIVAVNKMDKPGADAEKIKKALTEFQMVPEEWGGDTLYVPVSAKTGLGIPQLLEMLLLQADVLELKANPNKPAKGTVVESELDKRRGSVVTVLVQSGTLHEGDDIVVGNCSGRVRAMSDDRGKRLKEAGPSTPVEIMGLDGIPTAGDSLVVVEDEKKAKQVAELRQSRSREQDMNKNTKVSLEDLYDKIEKGDIKELNVIVKADMTGSVEVLAETLQKLSTPKVAVRVIHGAVGGISESDINLAISSGALIIGFHVRADAKARAMAEQHKVDLRHYDVIYELTDDVTKAMAGLLAPKQVEKVLGRAQIREIFSIPKAGTVAGCSVTEGKILRNARVRLLRDNVTVYTGTLNSLRRFKDDAREVTTGLECGMSIANFNDVKVGDVIEAYQIDEIAATLE